MIVTSIQNLSNYQSPRSPYVMSIPTLLVFLSPWLLHRSRPLAFAVKYILFDTPESDY